MANDPKVYPTILRQTAESESFRWIVEHRHLTEAAELIDTLTADIARLRAALEHIANPLDYIRAEAEREGKQIDGVWTALLLKDANYYRGIAEKAIAPHAAGARGE